MYPKGVYWQDQCQLWSKRTQEKDKFDLFLKSEKLKYEVSKRVGYLCKFSCKICNYSSKKWNDMTKHLNTKSHGTIYSPTQYVTRTILHKCCLCNELLFCDYNILQAHLKRQHKLTPKAYKILFPTIKEHALLEYMQQLRACVDKIPAVKTNICKES